MKSLQNVDLVVLAPGRKADEGHEMKKYNTDRKLNWKVCDGDSMQQKTHTLTITVSQERRLI